VDWSGPAGDTMSLYKKIQTIHQPQPHPQAQPLEPVRAKSPKSPQHFGYEVDGSVKREGNVCTV